VKFAQSLTVFLWNVHAPLSDTAHIGIAPICARNSRPANAEQAISSRYVSFALQSNFGPAVGCHNGSRRSAESMPQYQLATSPFIS
jgi:hypothetical protein